MNRIMMLMMAVMSLVSACDAAEPLPDADMPFPGPVISAATVKAGNGAWTLGNNVITATFVLRDGVLRLSHLQNLLTGEELQWSDGNLFTIYPQERVVASSSLKLLKNPECTTIEGDPKAARLSERVRGEVLKAEFLDSQSSMRITWRAILRDGSGTLRQEITLGTENAVDVANIEMLRVVLAGAKLSSYTDGSPVVAGNWFLGLEHPMAKTAVTSGEIKDGASTVVSYLPRQFVLSPGKTWTVSTGIGVAPAGQMRRAFACYLERERAHPYRQYWHYNSWYDLNIGRNDNPDPLVRMNEAQCLKVIEEFDKNLFQTHGVGLNGFVWDDGWDDWNSLWQFHKGFPNGFAKLCVEARKQGAGMGAWLSPWGGYGGSHEMRVKLGKAKCYETNRSGFSLGGVKYYAAFRDTCVKMIRDYGQNYFKFDGIGGGAYATGASTSIAADLDGLVRLLSDLRRENPEVFINCTVGTWASPYWVMFADSVWRQGDDTDFSGKGNNRERWINYKDKLVYERFVAKSPLFPVNSLMYHGLVVGPTCNPGAMPPPAKDPAGFKHEMRMMAGYSSGLGELYVTPSLMTPDAWAGMAESIQWSRARKNIVVDSHWVGGNPGKEEVYGFAAWHPKEGGVVTLRNPSDKPQAYALDLQAGFELAPGAARSFELTSPYKDQRVQAAKAEAGKPVSLMLEPFEVLVFDVQ